MKTSVLILTAICLFIIMVVGLDLPLKICSIDKGDEFNLILINLSYSYLAGFIFYILVTYLPERARKNKIRPIIKVIFDKIENQISYLFQAIHDKEIKVKISNLTKEQVDNAFRNLNFGKNCFYAKEINYNMTIYHYFSVTRKRILKLIEDILIYNQYLSTDEIEKLENLKNDVFFNFFEGYPVSNQEIIDLNSSSRDLSALYFKLLSEFILLNTALNTSTTIFSYRDTMFLKWLKNQDS